MGFWRWRSSLRPENTPYEKRCMHKSEELETILNALPLEEQVRRNSKIQADNDRRHTACAVHSADNTKPNGSPTASLIKIDNDEYDLIRTTKSLHERLSKFLGNRFKIWARRADAEEEEREERREREWIERQRALKELSSGPNQLTPAASRISTVTAASATARDPRIAPKLKELEHDDTEAKPIIFPLTLFITANTNNTLIPLPFFTMKNLSRLVTEGPQCVIASRDLVDNEKTYTYDLAKLATRFGIAVNKMSPTKGLSYDEFTKAANNFYNFECEQDPGKDKGKYATWAKKHFDFFTNKPDTHNLYPYWKLKELELREKRWRSPYLFLLTTYTLFWEGCYQTC
ncbi:hypothetical protein VKT23_015229 [Stygiomarasmius scandens]|uniref:Uncharacterized protein n=1 Tax=Marasmiellus scandens TaxID=2682957 RepID=A0ABR1J1S3_9AGAR